jgi:hypothetical protein
MNSLGVPFHFSELRGHREKAPEILDLVTIVRRVEDLKKEIWGSNWFSPIVSQSIMLRLKMPRPI